VKSPALLAGLMAARNANFINYVATNNPDPVVMLDGMFRRLENSLEQMDIPPCVLNRDTRS